jgi:hypothetical protein
MEFNDEGEEQFPLCKQEQIEHPTPSPFEETRERMKEETDESVNDFDPTTISDQANHGELCSQHQDDAPSELPNTSYHPSYVINGTFIETDERSIELQTKTLYPLLPPKSFIFYKQNSHVLKQLVHELVILRERSSQRETKMLRSDGVTKEDEMQTSVDEINFEKEQLRVPWQVHFCEILRLTRPPGADTTTALTEWAWYYLQQNMSVLLLSQTNTVLQNAVMGVRKRCEGKYTSWILDHHILLAVDAKDLDEEVSPEIVYELNVDQELGGIAMRRERLKRDEGALISAKAAMEQLRVQQQLQWKIQRHDMMNLLEREEKKFEAFSGYSIEMRDLLQKDLNAHREKWNEAQQKIARFEEVEYQFTEKIFKLKKERKEDGEKRIKVQAGVEKVRAMNPFLRFFYIRSTSYHLDEEKLHLNRLNEDILKADKEMQDLQEGLLMLRMRLLEVERVAEKEKEREHELIDRLASSSRPLPRFHEQQWNELTRRIHAGDEEMTLLEQRIEQICHEQDEVREHLRRIEMKQDVINKRLVANADLIATTLSNMSNSPYLKERVFGCVILCEAPTDALLVAIEHASKRVNVITSSV